MQKQHNRNEMKKVLDTLIRNCIFRTNYRLPINSVKSHVSPEAVCAPRVEVA